MEVCLGILPRGHGLVVWSHYEVADSNGQFDLFRDEHATCIIIIFFFIILIQDYVKRERY